LIKFTINFISARSHTRAKVASGASRIVHLLGGEISFESELGRGTTVSVKILNAYEPNKHNLNANTFI